MSELEHKAAASKRPRRLGGKRWLPRIRLERNTERGQAIVLIALTLVLLIGMAALAIDGGGVLFLRRDAQNAADAAAIAASRADCAEQGDEGTTAETANNLAAVDAGIEAAMLNGFATGHNNANARNVTVVVEVSPATLPPGAVAGSDPENYTVATIYATKPSYFSHLLFKDALTVMAVAISECEPANFREGAKAIVGFGDQCTNAVNGSGSGWNATGGVGSASGCSFTGGGQDFNLDTGACAAGTPNASSQAKFGDPTPEWDQSPSDLADDPLDDIYIASDWNKDGLIGEAALYDSCPDAEPLAADPDGAGPFGTGTCWQNRDPSTATVLEGIYYWEGPFAFTGSGVYIGPKGATIVVNDPATGEIGLKNFSPCPAGVGANACSVAAEKVQPYQLRDTDPGAADLPLDTYLATLSDTDDIEFVTSIYRSANWLLVHTNYNPGSPAAQCNTSAGNAGIGLGPFTNNFYGVIYASDSACTASFSDFTGSFGAVICVAVDFTGSQWELHWDPAVLPPTNARIGISR